MGGHRVGALHAGRADEQRLRGDLRGSTCAAERALALDPERPEAAIVLATITGIPRDLEWKPAMASLRALLRRYPHLTVARSNLASLLQYLGAFDEALEQLALARMHDPLSLLVRMNDANIRAYARRHDEARRGWSMLRDVGAAPIWIHLFSGNNETLGRRAGRGGGDVQGGGGAASGQPDAVDVHRLRARAARRCGAGTARRGTLHRPLPQTSAYQRAMLAGAARDKPGVLARLRDARSLHDPLLMSACVDPSFEWLAADRDFNRLLRDWGLPGWSGPSAPVARTHQPRRPASVRDCASRWPSRRTASSATISRFPDRLQRRLAQRAAGAEPPGQRDGDRAADDAVQPDERVRRERDLEHAIRQQVADGRGAGRREQAGERAEDEELRDLRRGELRARGAERAGPPRRNGARPASRRSPPAAPAARRRA